MKKSLLFVAAVAMAVMFASCASKKDVATSSIEEGINGREVVVENVASTGVEMAKTLNENGTKLVEVPFKWYSGVGTANDRQTAIEIAQREAYATISRTLLNIVEDEAEKAGIAPNGEVAKGFKNHWVQTSNTIQRGFEPFGENKIEYDPQTKMYTVTAKVGTTGANYMKALKEACNYNFEDLQMTKEEVKQLAEINNSIFEAAQLK